jgi:DNA-binding protein
MLKEFVERKEDELVALDFIGSRFRIDLMPVAKLTRNFDIDNFVKAASHCLDENIDTIYVVARGRNVVVARLVVSEIEKAKLYFKNKDWEYNVVGRGKGQLRCYLAELSRVP